MPIADAALPVAWRTSSPSAAKPTPRPAGLRRSWTRKPAVPAGHEIDRCAVCTKSMATHKLTNSKLTHSRTLFRVRPKAGLVSREAGFRVHRKRRRCSASQGQGMAAAMLAWGGAVPGPRGRHWRPAATMAFVVARRANPSVSPRICVR
jgi:hypothetical protein